MTAPLQLTPDASSPAIPSDRGATMAGRARLYAQLAILCDRDAAALCHEYEWPPVTPTATELDDAAHLTAIGDGLFARAEALGFSGGADAAFGGDDG